MGPSPPALSGLGRSKAHARGAARDTALTDGGQSLVELALALPLLLILLLGLVDFGRAYVYKSAISNAAREAALYAAKNGDATTAQVTQRACDETGFADYAAACATGLAVDCTPCPSGGADVTVTVSYTFSMVSGYLFQPIFGSDQLTVRTSATFPSLSQ